MGAFRGLLNAAAAGAGITMDADRRLRKYIAGLPVASGDEWKSYLGGEAKAFDPRTREGAVNLLGMALPGPKGGKARPLTKAQQDAMVRSGELAGGAVTIKKMSPAQMAAAKAERDSRAGHDTVDIIQQAGSDGIGFRHGQKGAENLLAIAKHPGHSNTSYWSAAEDVFGRKLTPAQEKALMDGPEGTRAAYIVDEAGRITVGGPGTHHDQLMKARGVEDPKKVIQGEIHFEQPLYDRPIPARLYTGRSLGGALRAPGGLRERVNKGPDQDLVDVFGPAKPNHLQTAAIEDWMNKANGVGAYVPLKGGPITPRPKVTMHSDPGVAADVARARVLRRKLAGEPNPLGKASPSALQIAGRANPSARSEAARLAGHPDNRGRDHTTQRVRLGVEEGGMGHGATARAPEQVVVPSKTTPVDKPRFIPKGKADLRRRPDRMH